ncbi:MAG TPA: hypothetical protein VGP02_19920 [Mycobacteriales bacterium]|jgi:hypothetical protein|nr:hypothetical protein [Mycobacteriales bacterium]
MEDTTLPELDETELDEILGGQGTQACAQTADGTCLCPCPTQ